MHSAEELLKFWHVETWHRKCTNSSYPKTYWIKMLNILPLKLYVSLVTAKRDTEWMIMFVRCLNKAIFHKYVYNISLKDDVLREFTYAFHSLHIKLTNTSYILSFPVFFHSNSLLSLGHTGFEEKKGFQAKEGVDSYRYLCVWQSVMWTEKVRASSSRNNDSWIPRRISQQPCSVDQNNPQMF